MADVLPDGSTPSTPLERAQGCLLGQLAGDALGSLVEFRRPEDIRRQYPHGVREMADGGTWNTLAGQPTDDSEMALALARVLAGSDGYDPHRAKTAYRAWLDSGPFDCGATIAAGLRGDPNPQSQANGSLMRISPLGIFWAGRTEPVIIEWASLDAAITHPHPVCVQASMLFTMTLAHAITDRRDPRTVYDRLMAWAREPGIDSSLRDATEAAAKQPPREFVRQQGWVLIAWQNALFQMLHAPSLEEGVVDTVMHGGDTDTNAAIAGALLGAVHGRRAVPERWVQSLLRCRPEQGRVGVRRPRPECYWPVDGLELAARLMQR